MKKCKLENVFYSTQKNCVKHSKLRKADFHYWLHQILLKKPINILRLANELVFTNTRYNFIFQGEFTSKLALQLIQIVRYAKRNWFLHTNWYTVTVMTTDIYSYLIPTRIVVMRLRSRVFLLTSHGDLNEGFDSHSTQRLCFNYFNLNLQQVKTRLNK